MLCWVHQNGIAAHSTYNPQRYQLIMNNIIQYFYSITQHKFQTENAVVHQVKTMETFILVQAVSDGLGVMLTKCSPTLNGFWRNQEEAVVNACLVSNG